MLSEEQVEPLERQSADFRCRHVEASRPGELLNQDNLAHYNLERSHQGYRLQGRTPAQALRQALGVETLPPVVPEEEVNQPEAA